MSGQLSMVLPALSTLGYKPRPELRRTFMAQVCGGGGGGQRQLYHTITPRGACVHTGEGGGTCRGLTRVFVPKQLLQDQHLEPMGRPVSPLLV